MHGHEEDEFNIKVPDEIAETLETVKDILDYINGDDHETLIDLIAESEKPSVAG